MNNIYIFTYHSYVQNIQSTEIPKQVCKPADVVCGFASVVQYRFRFLIESVHLVKCENHVKLVTFIIELNLCIKYNNYLYLTPLQLDDPSSLYLDKIIHTYIFAHHSHYCDWFDLSVFFVTGSVYGSIHRSKIEEGSVQYRFGLHSCSKRHLNWCL